MPVLRPTDEVNAETLGTLKNAVRRLPLVGRRLPLVGRQLPLVGPVEEYEVRETGT
jgi:hypothetical protein